MLKRHSHRGPGRASIVRAVAAVLVSTALTAPAFGQSGITEVLAVSGQAAPGLAGVTVQSFLLNNASRSGHAVMSATLAGAGVSSSNDSALLRFGGGASALVVAREGQTLAGIGTISSLFSPSPNASGQVAFNASLTGTAGGTNDNSGVFLTPNGSTYTQMFRKGTIATGTFTYSSFSGPILTDSGRVYTEAALAGAGLSTTNDRTMSVTTGLSTTNFLREGSSVNGVQLGSSYNYNRANAPGQLAVYNLGTLAQSGRLVLAYANGSTTLLASESDAAPGNGILNDFNNVTGPNDAGQVAFGAILTNTAGGTTDNSAMYLVSPGGTPVQIAREGQAAPGGGTLSSVSSFGVGLSQSGRVAFVATQTGSPNASLDGNSIFTGTGGSLTRIARVGQFFDASQTTLLENLIVEHITPSGAVFFYGYIIDFATDTFLRDGYFLGDGTEFVEITPRGTPLAGSTLAGIIGNGGSSRFFDDGRFIGQGDLADGRNVLYQFTPSLRYRTAFSSSWDTNSNWTVSLTPDAVHDVRIDPATSLTVTGPAAAVTVNSLTLGGGTGIGTLRLNGGTITATNGLTITATGALTGEGTFAGNVVNAGTITPTNLTITGGVLTNTGFLRGAVPGSTTYPTLTASITNTAGGEVRVAAGEYLRLAGAHFRNQGKVEVAGLPSSLTQIEFDTPVTNVASTGLITARSAILRFDQALLNQGSLAVASGINEVYGDITNAPGGSINVTGGAQANFYDDVVTNGTLRVAKVGSTTSVAVFMGSFSGAGGITGGGDVFLEGDLRPGNSPAAVSMQANVAFGALLTTTMELAGRLPGQFDQLNVTGTLDLSGTLNVTPIDGFTFLPGAPYAFTLFTATNLTGAFSSITLPPLPPGRQWDIYQDSTTFRITTFHVIPEPAALGLLAPALTLLRRRR